MTDRELLELAAKAYGIEGAWEQRLTGPGIAEPNQSMRLWNPLTEDGDALRLAVKLQMGLHYESQFFAGETQRIVEVYHSRDDDKCQCVAATYTDDPFAATRHAIVQAAAEIGRGLAEKGKQ